MSSKKFYMTKKSNFLTLIMIIISTYFLIPLIWVITSSTKNTTDLFSTFGLWFGKSFHLWHNLRMVFSSDAGIYKIWLMNSLIYSIVGALGAALLCTLAGYGFSKYKFVGSTAIFRTVLAAVMIPTAALSIPTFIIFSKLGLVNTRWAVILPSLISPLGVYLMKVYSDTSIPNNMIEAARIDGATEFKIFKSISLRMLMPGFVTVLLLSIVGIWNNFFLPLIMLSETNLQPLPVGLFIWYGRAYNGGSGTDPQFQVAVIASAGLSLLPLIIVFLFLQRYWENGLSLGAVKE
jgi:multiple sugar transport system permease protein